VRGDDGFALCPRQAVQACCAAGSVRDIRRKITGRPELEAVFEAPIARAAQIRSQRQRQRGWKLYSFHAPEVECIIYEGMRIAGLAGGLKSVPGPGRVKTQSVLWFPLLNRGGMMRGFRSRGGSPADDAVAGMP
jgi:hypothetical protein